jgi:hypothetical protein
MNTLLFLLAWQLRREIASPVSAVVMDPARGGVSARVL